jgi:hypothetical protein
LRQKTKVSQENVSSISVLTLDNVLLQNKYVRRLQAVWKAAGPEGIIAPWEHEELRKLLHGVLQVWSNLLVYLKGIVIKSED